MRLFVALLAAASRSAKKAAMGGLLPAVGNDGVHSGLSFWACCCRGPQVLLPAPVSTGFHAILYANPTPLGAACRTGLWSGTGMIQANPKPAPIGSATDVLQEQYISLYHQILPRLENAQQE